LCIWLNDATPATAATAPAPPIESHRARPDGNGARANTSTTSNNATGGHAATPRPTTVASADNTFAATDTPAAAHNTPSNLRFVANSSGVM
jgi:hypothetical protein